MLMDKFSLAQLLDQIKGSSLRVYSSLILGQVGIDGNNLALYQTNIRYPELLQSSW